MKKLTLVLVVALSALCLNAQESIKLPQPMNNGGLPVMDAIHHRQSVRNFKQGDISPEELSTILWAGFGYSRGDKRTAPTAMNMQDIDLYVFLESGIYKWNAKTNELKLLMKGDFRAKTDREGGFAAKVTNIAIVSDLNKYNRTMDENTKYTFGVMSSAYVSENMYLAVSGMPGLGTVVRYAAKQEREIKELLNLREGEKLLLFQTIGHTF